MTSKCARLLLVVGIQYWRDPLVEHQRCASIPEQNRPRVNTTSSVQEPTFPGPPSLLPPTVEACFPGRPLEQRGHPRMPEPRWADGVVRTPDDMPTRRDQRVKTPCSIPPANAMTHDPTPAAEAALKCHRPLVYRRVEPIMRSIYTRDRSVIKRKNAPLT